MTELERLAFEDLDRAAAAYQADPCEANRAEYEAATWAAAAAVEQAITSSAS